MLSNYLYSQNFLDRSTELGINEGGVNRGVAIGDFDNNGFEDIYVSRKDGPNSLFVNYGNFQFVESAEALGVADTGKTSGSLWIDFDNDGDLDLFCGNQFGQSKLFENHEGSFTDVSLDYGIYENHNIQSVNAVDFDNDGDLDIYLAQFNSENILYRNEGDYFLNYIQPSGISNDEQSMGAIFFDYDNDGDQDLYQTLDGNRGNLLFRNDEGFYKDVTQETNTAYEGQGMGVDVADLDNNGLFDIYFSNLHENILYLQNSNGIFEIKNGGPLQERGMGWGTSIFDSNNNGLLDIYVANDSHFEINGESFCNKMIVNQGNMEYSYAPDVNDLQNMYASYGSAYADFNNDGLMDLFVCNVGADGNQIFENVSELKNFVSIQLEGVVSNRQAIGASVSVFAEAQKWTKQLQAGSSYCSQNTSRIHFGLYTLNAVDSIQIRWPSGKIQTVLSPSINQIINIKESSGIQSSSEVVWTEPPFPTQLDDVTVYFDASQGNGALEGFASDIYAHTGVITSASSGPSDWQHVQGNWGTADANTLMTSEGNDIYSISYNIKDYYGINPGEIVEQLAFVFRDTGGNTVGRATDGSDIFLDIFPPDQGLLANLISPQENTIVNLQEDLSIQLQISKEAQVEITDNGVSVLNVTTDNIDFQITPMDLGLHTLEFTINDGTDEIKIDRNYIVIDPNESFQNAPLGTINGLNYYTDSSYVFQLTAPGKQNVFLLCPSTNFNVDINFKMTKSEDQNSYWIELPKSVFENNRNIYQYFVDGEIKIADPFSTVVLDPWNDDEVPADVMSTLPPYPTGFTTGIVTAFDLEKENFVWEDSGFEKPDQTNLIIYEILMRDFLEDKNYKSLIDTLDYLDRLGVTAIELMPISEFENNQSWGYNPSFHMAVDKYYGSRTQLKTVINEAHKRGITVILDVVFNHAFSQSPLCQLYWNSSDFQPSADSPYLNETPRHPFNVGYDFNHESQYTKQWVKQVLSYWMEEFHFDGFRFDLSKGLTQTFSGTNSDAMSQFDLSRVTILKDYADHIWDYDPDAYVIMEHFAVNSEEKNLSDYGMMLWGNTTHEFSEAAMGYSTSLDWADYEERDWDDAHLIAYMESHDEERMAYKLQEFGNSNAQYNTQNNEIGMQRIAAASAIYFSIPGPKMLWQFGELGYDFSINRCVNGAINPDCRLDPKPIRWDYLENENRSELYDRIAALSHLRNSYPDVFIQGDHTLYDDNTFVKSVTLTHPNLDMVSLANFRITESEVNPRFPNTGLWYEYFTGKEIEVVDVNESLNFDAGEYRIYTSEKITPPDGFFTSVNEYLDFTGRISPNPVSVGQKLQIELSTLIKVEKIVLKTIGGRNIELNNDLMIPNISPGLYILEIRTKEQNFTSKIIVVE